MRPLVSSQVMTEQPVMSQALKLSMMEARPQVIRVIVDQCIWASGFGILSQACRSSARLPLMSITRCSRSPSVLVPDHGAHEHQAIAGGRGWGMDAALCLGGCAADF